MNRLGWEAATQRMVARKVIAEPREFFRFTRIMQIEQMILFSRLLRHAKAGELLLYSYTP